MPELGTSGSAGGTLVPPTVNPKRARKRKRWIQPRTHLKVMRPAPYPDCFSPSNPLTDGDYAWLIQLVPFSGAEVSVLAE